MDGQVAAQPQAVELPLIRLYVDPLWIPRPDVVMPRFLIGVPLARAYGSGKCMLLDGTQALTEVVGKGSGTFLSDWERVVARHRALAGTLTIRNRGGGHVERTALPEPLQVLAVHVPTWDWDCTNGDVSLFVQSVNSVRGRTLLQRLGPSCMLSPFAVIDEQALEADASESVALALEAASCEALQRGKRALVKLPTLGAAMHLRTPQGLLVGPYAYRAFWRGVRLALARCSFPGIAVLECSDKQGAGNIAPSGSFEIGGITVVVPHESRDIADFSGLPEDLLPCIIVPGSSFQMAGGLASFQLTLESALAANSDMNLHFSPLFNVELVQNAPRAAIAATQPAQVRPHWWPPMAVRRAYNLQ